MPNSRGDRYYQPTLLLIPVKQSEVEQDLTYQFTTVKREMFFSCDPRQLLLSSLQCAFLLLTLWQLKCSFHVSL